ncbi:MAG TPA: ABC transporter ATP-binding protein [Coxiellaceae bacterium]|nr:ABC transporter ATP-binding protein [Coxiellaceae bacterium]
MNALSINNLSKIYEGGLSALQHVNIDVKTGDFFALLGPNGAGKSTLIGIITGTVTKTGGQVIINGCDIDQDFSAAKAMVGVVPQEFNFNYFLTPYSVLLNQAGYYGIRMTLARQRTEHYLHLVGLWEKRHQKIRFLSGGMKRRLMIARALVHEPRLLILDEPTAGVDIEIRRSMWELFKQLNEQGITIILTTHYLEEAENLCRNIAIINHGRIIEQTSMNKLLRQLDKESFILYLKNPTSLWPSIPNHLFHPIDDMTVEVELPKGETITALLAQLAEENIEVMSLKNKSNRLEELFIHLTKDVSSHE